VTAGFLMPAWRKSWRTAPRFAYLCLAIATAITALAPVRQAMARASLLSAEPVDGVTIDDAPATFRLDFNEPVSPLVMRLVRPSGQVAPLTGVVAADRSVTITAPEMAEEGTYVLNWRVVSADGHPLGGVVTFAVGHPSSAASVPRVEGAGVVHAALWAVQWILAIGMYIGVGAAFFAAWLAAKQPLPRAGLLVALMFGAIAATVVSIPLQGLDALAEPLRHIWRPGVWTAGFATSWGWAAVIAVATLVAGLLALGFDNLFLKRTLASLAIAGIGAALLASGHASTAEPRLAVAPAVFLHGVCVAFWVGSLLPLAIVVRAGDRVALARFSRLIPLPLVVLIASGIMLAYAQLDRLDALWTTDYGRVLSAKIAMVMALLALAALNRYAVVPRLAIAGARRLVTIIAAEFTLAVIILGLVGLWRFMPPPIALAAVDSIVIHFHGEQAMVQMTLRPERDRGASMRIAVTDGDERPLAAKEVDVAIWNPGAGIEPIRRSATAEGGAWRIAGVHIPIAGVWRMRVEILIGDFDKITLEDNVELPRTP
jgi:copper transport protein